MSFIHCNILFNIQPNTLYIQKVTEKSICFSWRHINFIYDKTFSIGFEFHSQFFFYCHFMCECVLHIRICKVLRVESICGCKATQSFFHFCGDSRKKNTSNSIELGCLRLEWDGLEWFPSANNERLHRTRKRVK